MSGYILGSGIAFQQDRARLVVTIEITDEELIRNPAVWDAAMTLVDQAKLARNTPLELQPTQPTQNA